MNRRPALTLIGSLAAALVIAIAVFLATTGRGESPSPDGPAEPPDLTSDQESRVVDFAAAAIGAPRTIVRLLESEPVVWSNTCLEIRRPDTLCGQALVPGYRLTIGYEINGRREGVTHEFHTDEEVYSLLWQASEEAEGVVETVSATSVTLRGSGGVFDRAISPGSLELRIAPGSDFIAPRANLGAGERVRFGFDPRPSSDGGVLVWIAPGTQ
jgi:hypothetical protein